MKHSLKNIHVVVLTFCKLCKFPRWCMCDTAICACLQILVDVSQVRQTGCMLSQPFVWKQSHSIVSKGGAIHGFSPPCWHCSHYRNGQAIYEFRSLKCWSSIVRSVFLDNVSLTSVICCLPNTGIIVYHHLDRNKTKTDCTIILWDDLRQSWRTWSCSYRNFGGHGTRSWKSYLLHRTVDWNKNRTVSTLVNILSKL